MTLVVTGLSHHSSPVKLRERMAFPEDAIPAALNQLKRTFPDAGAVILSTCNRVELYLNAPAASDTLHQALRRFLSEWHRVPQDAFACHLYNHDERDAVGHLFRVASSLDSLVVGEGQILGQVHDAYLLSQTEGATDKILSGLFQRAAKVAKEVHTKTSINVGKVSVASVAVDLAVTIFSDLADKRVMVIGSGETGELALKSLVSRGVGEVIVVNRTIAHAEKLAEQYRGEAMSLDMLHKHLHRADIVISSTASPDPILHAADFEHALKARNQEPMFVIDIAVPRDIAPDVNDLDNVYLYDIDNLESVTRQNIEQRRAEMDRCLEIVEKQVDQFMRWRSGLSAEPMILSMTRELNSIRERELEKTFATLPDLTERQRNEVEYLTKRIVNTILQRPMTQIKQEVSQDDPNRVLHLVRRLFGLEENPS
jgi:glutamyl-tRNA reductase